jgi:hypothetical protein
MAEASTATTIHDEHDGHCVYSSGGACLRHAGPTSHDRRPFHLLGKGKTMDDAAQ